MNSNDTESQDLCRKTGNDPKLRFSTEKLKSGNICLCIIVVCCVLLCSLLCASIFIYTHSTLKVMEERLSELSQELSKLRSECGSKSLSEQQVVTEESGSENQTLEIVYRNERSPKKLSLKKPVGAPAYIHLVGKEKGKLLNIEGEDTYFAWDKDENSPGLHGFELVPVGDNSYYKIKVKHPGVYLVYTQVGINGRDNINQPHECSHETVVQRMVKKKVEKTVLLKSLITQYELLTSMLAKNLKKQMMKQHWVQEGGNMVIYARWHVKDLNDKSSHDNRPGRNQPSKRSQ